MGHELKTERELSLDFLRVCEAAAIAAARTMGQGDRKYSDHVAVEAMREVMDTVPMRGRIVIGEGERDEAPMLYIGEEVGGGYGVSEDLADSCPEVDIAVDPLEGTNLCAMGANNDAAAHRHRVHNFAHRFDRDVVGILAVALAHSARRSNCRCLTHAQEIQRQLALCL